LSDRENDYDSRVRNRMDNLMNVTLELELTKRKNSWGNDLMVHKLE